MKGRFCFAGLVAALLVAGCVSGRAKGPATAPQAQATNIAVNDGVNGQAQAPTTALQAQVVDLTFAEAPEADGITYGYSLRIGEPLTFPFANAAGKLTFQLVDGKVQADTNGDGVIDSQDAPPVKPRNVTIRVAATVVGQAVQYPFFIREASQDDSRWSMQFSPRGMLQGRCDLGTIRILNYSRNGAFGDTNDQVVRYRVVGHEEWFPWSPTLAMDNQLYQVRLLGGGKQLSLTPYTGPVAQVKLVSDLPGGGLWATLKAVNGEQIASLTTGQTRLMLPGQYRINCSLSQPNITLPGRSTDQMKPIELKPGPNVVKLGPPFTLSFTAHRNGNEVQITAVDIQGCSGEYYSFYPREGQDEFVAVFLRTGRSEQQLGKMAYG